MSVDLVVWPLLFMLFWFWILVLGIRGVVGRMAQLWKWLCTPWGSNDDLFPTLRGPIGQSWSDEENRQLSALAARTPVPAIRNVTDDMQQALDEERRMAERLGRDIADWEHAIGQLKRSADDWTEKAAVALSHERNDLARAAIAERMRTQQRVADLEKDVAEMRRLLTTHASDIQSLEINLSTIYRRNHIAETRLHAAESSARSRQLLYGEHVKDALNRFEELERAADLAEGHADSLAMGSEPPAMDRLAIDAQLAALRPAGGFGRKRIAS